MANYKVWNVQRRHEWLATPLKKKRITRRTAQRVGLLAAWIRQGKASETVPENETKSESKSETKSETKSEEKPAEEKAS